MIFKLNLVAILIMFALYSISSQQDVSKEKMLTNSMKNTQKQLNYKLKIIDNGFNKFSKNFRKRIIIIKTQIKEITVNKPKFNPQTSILKLNLSFC